MGQKRYSASENSTVENVAVATDATSIGTDSIRLIVKDDLNNKQIATLIDRVKTRFLQDPYPFT